MRRMLSIPGTGRAIGFALVAVAIVVAAVHARRGRIEMHAPSATESRQGDPLAVELARCQAIGMAAKDDGSCAAAWAENRRRFFTYQSAQPLPAKSQER